MASECVKWDYVYWKNFLHSPARVWEEVWWVAKETFLTDAEGKKRFGKNWKNVSLDHQSDNSKTFNDDPSSTKEAKATVYEIWSKRHKKVIFLAKACDHLLEEVDPFVNLDDFFPCPKPVWATLTTDSLVPTPDYAYYRDQAEEIDELTARIGKLTDALKLVGFYAAGDKNAASIEKALEPGVENRVIPVESWAVFQEKGAGGGLAWLPIKDVAEVLKACLELRTQLVNDVYQIYGLSDIMRGTVDPDEKLGQTEIKSQWGSIRTRQKQQAFADFARDAIKIAGEIISERYSPQTIIEMSNMQPEKMQEIQAAIQLLRDERLRCFRIDIETDSTIQPDENAEKQRRTEFVTAIGGFMKEAVPLASAAPPLIPMIAETLLFTVRGFRAGRELEDTIEQAAASMQQMAAQAQQAGPPPDPKVLIDKQRFEEIDKPKADKEIELKDREILLKDKELALKDNQMTMQNNQAAFDQRLGQQKLDLGSQELAHKKEMSGFEQQRIQQDIGNKAELAGIDRTIKKRDAFSSGMKTPVAPAPEPELPPDPMVVMQQGFVQLMQVLQGIAAQQAQMMEFIAAPVEVIRDGNGRIVSAQKVLPQRTVN
jgi:hypothetical protein